MGHDTSLDLLTRAFDRFSKWMSQYAKPTVESLDGDEIQVRAAEVLTSLAERLEGNYPFHSGLYAGQMLKPPHDVAWAAYALTMLINPNNHALDGGPPTSQMEKELIPEIAGMFGYKHGILGHLTSSGTIANLEALWVARKINPTKAVGFSSQAHYTHARMCEVLGIRSFVIPTDADGNWDVDFLEQNASEIGTVVVTMGTTGMGRVEPLHTILPLCKKMGIRVHLDAAYGGYFSLISRSGEIDARAWSLTSEADSIVVDPHKHGLQPYGCGCVLFRDPKVGLFYKHDSPYTYFSSDELHLGEISLECSRAGAAAAALWATLQVFDLGAGGRMEAVLRDCRNAALTFAREVVAANNYILIEQPELDIVVYCPLVRDESGIRSSEISRKSSEIFHAGMNGDRNNALFVSLYQIDPVQLKSVLPDLIQDQEKITVLRSVFMKPHHKMMTTEIVRRLNDLYRQTD